MTTTVEDFIAGGGAPAAKFPTIGTVIKGTIESAEVSQQTDIQTGEPKVWPDGNPRLQLIITLATDDRDADVDNDDGKRRLFMKGQMLAALKETLRAAGTKSPEVGGTLAVQYKEDGEKKNAAFSPQKIYVVQYKAPAAATVSVDELI